MKGWRFLAANLPDLPDMPDVPDSARRVEFCWCVLFPPCTLEGWYYDTFASGWACLRHRAEGTRYKRIRERCDQEFDSVWSFSFQQLGMEVNRGISRRSITKLAALSKFPTYVPPSKDLCTEHSQAVFRSHKFVVKWIECISTWIKKN